MEVIIRAITFRGEIEYIIDPGEKLVKSSQLSLLMKASYNSLLTDPDVIERMPEWADYIMDLKNAVEKFLISTSNLKN